MKSFAVLSMLSSGAAAHYFFPNTIVDGAESGDFEYIRETANVPSSGPIEDVTSPLMGCYEKDGHTPPDVLSIAAGSDIGFTASAAMSHPGPSLFYMARVPEGEDVTTWLPTDDAWFKIDEHGALEGSSGGLEFEDNMLEVHTSIPSAVPSGEYLLRVEHIGLHVAGGPQFYIACAQLDVTDGGDGEPGPLVSFPGAYSMDDPGLAVNIYMDEGPYEYPGPEVWSG